MSMRNASRFLRECMDSVLSQTFTDFELLIVDDGSTDDSVDIVRSYTDPRIRLICREHDFIASLNTLLDEARGRYIARMDADDVMLPDRLQAQYDYLTGHPEVVAVCSQADRIDQTGGVIGHIGHGDDIMRITPRMMCETNHICNPSTMMRRDIVREAGLRYEREYEFAEDYRFWSRVVSECGPVDCLPEQLLNYRISDTQVTATRWDEMMEATERVKRALTDRLVNLANPGYHDPVIPESDRQLSLIIPFLNEGEEVERTVKSFLEHGGADNVDIIVINDCSYDSYPYLERLAAIPGVSYFLNRERLGVAGSRDKGVALCRTPYFLLLDAHMRAYDDSWLTTIPTLLRENDRRILCCQTRVLEKDDNGNITETSSIKNFGCRLTFTARIPIPGIEWVQEEREPNQDIEPIQAILGAGYGISKRYWNHIGGLKGLTQYGCDEQMLSLKSWLEGGSCVLLKKVILGHIYRNNMPYKIRNNILLRNSLMISESIFPPKEKYRARAYAYTFNQTDYSKHLRDCLDTISKHPEVKNWCKGSMTRSFGTVVAMSHQLSHQVSKIKSLLPSIASKLLEGEPCNPGLFDGKAGYAVWLLIYSDFINDHDLAGYAHRTIADAINECDINKLDFSSGITGIGWAIQYLQQTGRLTLSSPTVSRIDKSIANAMDAINPATYGVSLSTGVSGILAYYCTIPLEQIPESLRNKLNQAADAILLAEKATPIEVFYAITWKEMYRYNIHLEASILDWINPMSFIPQNPRFWKLSLFDGVLATSAAYMINNVNQMCHEEKSL